MNSTSRIRPSPIAGRWYPAQAETLARIVDGYLGEEISPPLQGQVIAVIAPHAGYQYSGRTAGFAFSALKNLSPELVAVISPFHEYPPGPLMVTQFDAYSTPLGVLPVDQKALGIVDGYLQEAGVPCLTRVSRELEHSLEIELPFLQRSLKHPFRLLPIMIGTHNPVLLHHLADGLAAALQSSNGILVASSDLSHFYPQETANELDAEMLRRIESLSPESILAAEEEGTGFACGVGAISAVTWAAKLLGANAVRILHHSTSAEQTGDTHSVVGYGAVAILKI